MLSAGRLALLALDGFLAFVALGILVSRLSHSIYDLRAARVRGRAIALAVIFAESGRSRALTIAAVLAVVAFAIARWPLWIPIAVMLSQITSQACVEGVKRLYRRARPRDWLVRAEYGFSYPSGHASTAATFYLTWALVAALLPLPVFARASVATVLVLWALGVMWSRLALAAHYATDVLGGLLFGSAWIALMLALVARDHLRLI